MTDEDRAKMAAHGITCVPKNVYYYGTFKYESLGDALRYAEIDAARVKPTDVES